jgi:hypothetical protein
MECGGNRHFRFRNRGLCRGLSGRRLRPSSRRQLLDLGLESWIGQNREHVTGLQPRRGHRKDRVRITLNRDDEGVRWQVSFS